ncbi:MAG: hypothetical protein JSR72_23295 [Proteobacteria bacterium]|nr:hypothetical protein [Pseudomonadota bacterium]
MSPKKETQKAKKPRIVVAPIDDKAVFRRAKADLKAAGAQETEQLEFTTRRGDGRVNMRVRLTTSPTARGNATKVAIRMPETLKVKLQIATEGRNVNTSLIGLAWWALEELERRNLDLDIDYARAG